MREQRSCGAIRIMDVYVMFRKRPACCLGWTGTITGVNSRQVFLFTDISDRKAGYRMLQEGIDGFCMALADSVPGVSGGTVAFIMGFYDRFIGSIDRLVFGKVREKKEGLSYLLKLGIGWAAGMALAVLALTALFESHIYLISSVFIGFIIGAVPLIIRDEKESFCQIRKGILFLIAGIALVALVTAANGLTGSSSADLSRMSAGLGIRLFLIGMVAISAMFLPGISGSTMLLVFGVYLPVMTAIRGVLHMNLAYLPALLVFACGILAGAATVVRGIRICLEKFRPQTVYLILGMMIGSLYAIVMGPTTLKVPQMAMTPGSFSILAAVLGAALVLGMQAVRDRRERKET